MIITQEESKFHSNFIIECVNKNVYLPTNNKFATTTNLSVQDIVHSNTNTLRTIGKSLEKAAKDSGDSRFNLEGPLKISGIEVNDWINFLAIQIKISTINEEALKNKLKREQIKKEIAELITPSEKKEILQKELEKLDGVETVKPVETLA